MTFLPLRHNPVVRLRFLTGILSSAFLIGIATGADAQTKRSTEDSAATAYTEALARNYPIQNEQFLSRLKAQTTDKKLLKHYENNFKSIFKALNEEIKEGQMIYVAGVTEALNEMLNEIKAKNPHVPDDIQILLLREDLPNAHTMGDNNLFVNLGLFFYLEDEDQVASVLAHEIGHLQLRHTLKALNYNYEREKASEADVKALRRSDTRKADRALEVLQTAIYKGGRMRREHELQADSAGYEMLKNTKYRKTAFAEALEIIERNDTTRHDGLAIETYKRYFDLPNQQFQEKWLEAEDFSSYNYDAFKEKFNKDSVSTHPKSQDRIQHLRKIFPELAQEEVDGTRGTEQFKKLRVAAERQRIPNLYFNERYGEAVYLSLLYLQRHPDDAYYKKWLGKSFKKIYEARRDYQLNKYLDRVSPKDQTESYIRFLSFMWNLKLEEMKTIAGIYAGNG